MSEHRIPSAFATTLTIAALTLRRLLRGRALWVSLVIASLPILYAGAMQGMRASGYGVGEELFVFEMLVMAVLAPMFVGSSIGEEIEDRTTTYLWSRPVPRWAVLAGKLLALAPLAAAIVVASWALASLIAWDALPSLRTSGALAAGAVAVSLVASGIATLGPKHGMALTIVYLMFFDLAIGIMPATLREASILHQVLTLSEISSLERSDPKAMIAIVAIAGVWALIAALRVRRLEA